MNKVILAVFLYMVAVGSGHAAVWVKLQENKDAKLMLDKQSVLEVDKLKRAWIKIVYKTPQTNVEVADKTYNLSKLLWFFDCATQKAATSQVFQFSNEELIYSAAVDSKMAKFIEPVPETDIDVAMRHVCNIGTPAMQPEDKPVPLAKPKAEKVEKETAATQEDEKEAKPEAPEPAVKPKVEKKEQVAKRPEETKEKQQVAELGASDSVKEKTSPANLPIKPEHQSAENKHWGYEGKEGPEFWGKLSPEYATCDIGLNQSPINIEHTVNAILKPLKTFQRFPAYDIINNGHTIQVNFKQGNMVALESVLYHMRQVHFHSPSENTIHGQSFPLEAHFVHQDDKGKLVVIAVMFEEGEANSGLARLWGQIPTEVNTPKLLKGRITPSDLIPKQYGYYRFSGSLTTPPCSEGVSWIVMKTPMTVSKAQIDAFKKAIHHDNNRPVQALNGRLVIE